ncbi:MAG: NfeD family protein [Clostridiales bacterium]|nr:NfeD family protein [Clostridiales bacterium]
MSTVPMWVIWLILLVISLIIEAATMGLTTVWCAVGCLVALIMDLCHADVVAQIVVMAIVTVISFIVCIIWIKPVVDARRMGKIQPTNADRVIGHEGVVIVPIDPVAGKGQVKVDGQIWSAKCDVSVEEGAKVKILALEGVKAVVEPVR